VGFDGQAWAFIGSALADEGSGSDESDGGVIGPLVWVEWPRHDPNGSP
jgi:hypothetical protein